MIFDNELEARKFFNSEVDIEACDKCGRFSASKADDWENGEIVSCHCDYDRICLDCDEEEENI
jgi:hypothetical protein